jgi:hypothetical protein
MLRSDSQGLGIGGGDEGASSQVICLSKQASRTLMDGGDGMLIEEVFVDSGYGEVVLEIILHVLTIDPFEVSSGYDSGSEGCCLPRYSEQKGV